MIQQYAKMIKDKEMTPKQAGMSYVMQEIWGQVEEWKQQGIDNASEKKFVIALAKIHNQLADRFVAMGGDTVHIDIETIQINN